MSEPLKNLDKLLRSANDLEKIDLFIKNTRKDLNKEKQEYKEHLMRVLYNLNQNQSKVFAIKNDKKQYEDTYNKNMALLESFSDYVKDYDKIEFVSIAYRNFVKVKDLNTKLDNLEDNIQDMKNRYKNNEAKDCKDFDRKEYGNFDMQESQSRFKEDDNVANVYSNFDFQYFLSNESLLDIHQMCFNFEELKYELLFYCKDVDKEAFFLVQRKINSIDQILVDFMVCFLKLSINYTETLAKVLKGVNIILDLEEERDNLTRKVNDKSANDLISKEISNMHYRYADREEKRLLNKLENAIKNDIEYKFTRIKSREFLEESFQFIFDDLRVIKSFIEASESTSHEKRDKVSSDNNSVTNKSVERSLENDILENTGNETSDELSADNDFAKNKNGKKSLGNMSVSTSDETTYKQTNRLAHSSQTLKSSYTRSTTNNALQNVSASLENLSIKQKNTKKIDWVEIIHFYHKELRDFFESKMFSSDDILFILDFTKNYYEFLESVMKIPKESLGDEILGKKENELINEYIKCATSSLSAWVDNLKNNELDFFFTRETPPTLDEEEKYTSLNFINLLQLIKQQLEPIAYNLKIFKVMIKEVINCVKSFSKEIIKAMDKDFLPACKQKCNPGYEEFVIMFGNSGLKVTQYVSSLPQAQTNEVRELGNIFINITKKSNYYLSSFVIFTCKPVIDKIFTDEWYSEDITKVLIVTLDDFLVDYRLNMTEFSFITFVYELCNELTKSYLKQLIRKRAKIYEDCGYKLNKDLDKFVALFNKYGNEEEVQSNLEAFKRIIPLLGRCNEEMFIVEFKAFLTVYPDIKRDYIKNIVYKKDEMDENSKRRLWLRIKECFKNVSNIRTTLFSTI